MVKNHISLHEIGVVYKCILHGLICFFQVVAPGDVAFNLGGNSNATAESVVIETTNRNDADGICMSVSSFVGGLVMLLLLLVVASLVAAFLFVRVRSIHKKTAIFANGFDNPDYLKHQTGAN